MDWVSSQSVELFRYLFCQGDRGERGRKRWTGQTHFAIFGEIDLQCFGIVLEPQRSHGKEDVLAIDRLALLLLTLFGRFATGTTLVGFPPDRGTKRGVPSLVMKEMNSLTHSCMHSLASLAILAFSGNAVFMIRATGAKLRMLASEAAAPCARELVSCEAEGEGGE